MHISATIKPTWLFLILWALVIKLSCLAQGIEASLMPTPPLIWDATTKEFQAQSGDTNGVIIYSVTNTTSTNITIRMVRPSCGCTVAKLPAIPWIIPARTNSQMQLIIDLRGKRGTLNKYIAVDSTVGFQTLILRVQIPDATAGSGTARSRNQKIALADRQAVFRGDCIPCHVTTTLGKTGAALYDAACGICHDAKPKATMVPGLQAKRSPQYREYWYRWTAKGREGTLMPAFETAAGGPLSEAQIQSLADYLTQPQSSPHSPSPDKPTDPTLPVSPRP